MVVLWRLVGLSRGGEKEIDEVVSIGRKLFRIGGEGSMDFVKRFVEKWGKFETKLKVLNNDRKRLVDRGNYMNGGGGCGTLEFFDWS